MALLALPSVSEIITSLAQFVVGVLDALIELISALFPPSSTQAYV